jgi:uncharacterized membrane protein YbhN (UPF0104 family)
VAPRACSETPEVEESSTSAERRTETPSAQTETVEKQKLSDREPTRQRGKLQSALRVFWIVFAVVVVGLISRLAWNTEWSDVGAALTQREWSTLLLIAGAAGLSHIVFGLYDVLSKRIVAPRLPLWRTWLTATSCYALNLNLGALIGGVGLRYKLYRRQQVPPASATRIITLGIVANWIGYAIVVTALLPWASSFGWNRWLSHGQAMLACVAGVALVATFLVLCARGAGTTIRGHRFEPLPLRLAVPQVLLSAANWAWLGFVMSLCLGSEVTYAEALGVLLASAVAGAVAHVPGGWGVIEVVVVALLADRLPQSQLIASVLVFRVANYLLPLPAALVSYLMLSRSGSSVASDVQSTKEEDSNADDSRERQGGSELDRHGTFA